MSDHEEPHLPEHVIDITAVRLKRNAKPRCTCDRRHRHFEVDKDNREVTCAGCGAVVDPFEAMVDVAYFNDHLHSEIEALWEQRKQIVNYKPHLLVFRDLESQYRGKKWLPICPNCHQAFFFEEVRAWAGREIEVRRRRRAAVHQLEGDKKT